MSVKSSKSMLLFALIFALSLISCAKPESLSNNYESANQSSARVSESTDAETSLTAEAEDLVAEEDEISLLIGGINYRVEYADTPQKRQLGLMYRREMCENCGMLFKFDRPRIGSIWMKNTFIPLDLAYIDARGTIIDIEQLEPHNLNSVQSSATVLYALEMNEGWFAKHDIRVGDKVRSLP